MVVTKQSDLYWRIDFSSKDMEKLERASHAVGLPLASFGGLSTASPKLFIVAAKVPQLLKNLGIEMVTGLSDEDLLKLVNSLDVDKLFDKFGAQKLELVESLPAKAVINIRTKIVECIKKYIPSGFFARVK